MAFCIQCGAKLSDNQKFCSECGTAQPVREVQPPVAPTPEENRTTYIPLTNEEPMERTTFIPKQGNSQPRQPAYEQPRQYSDPWQQPQAPGYQPQPGFTFGAGNEKQPPKKKKKGGLIALILVLLLLVGGAAAFFFLGGMDLIGGDKKAEENEDILGVYNAVSCIYKKEEQDIEDEWLELKSGGKGKLMMDDESFSFKWELDGEDLTIVQQGDEYEGTLEDDIIVIDLNGKEYTYILEDSDAEAEWEEQQKEDDAPAAEAPAAPEAPIPEAPAATEAPAMPEPVYTDPSEIGYWMGDYYGWWIVNTVYEGNPDEEGMWWDCCASLERDNNGNFVMTVWDEDGSRYDELGEVYMDVTIVDGNVAEFYSLGGSFGGVGVAEGGWYCRSDDDVDYDQTFWISSTYNNGEGLHFDYTFYMRPWGVSWSDIENTNPDLLPGYYDWYEDLLADGYTDAPDYIGGY